MNQNFQNIASRGCSCRFTTGKRGAAYLQALTDSGKPVGERIVFRSNKRTARYIASRAPESAAHTHLGRALAEAQSQLDSAVSRYEQSVLEGLIELAAPRSRRSASL